MPAVDFKYWAFLSYSHADEAWAIWLHKALERYRIPARLRGRETPHGKTPAKLFPVFRDRDELAGSAELGSVLQAALQASSAQIVICSPSAARSRWVNEEIKYFKSLNRTDRVLALIVDGEPHASEQGRPQAECFPQALRFHVDASGAIDQTRPVEPIAADVRTQGDGKSNAKLKLIAGILGLGFDDLRQRELQARNRRLALFSALSSGVAALTLALAIQAYHARNDAQRRQRQAEDLIQFMLGDLRTKLEPIGKLAILDAVGDKAMDYFATLDETDETDAVVESRATALRQIGQVRLRQGKLPEASAAFEQALKMDSELVLRHSSDAHSLFNVAESQFSVGMAHYSKGEVALALPWWEKQLETMRRLVALEPGNDKWKLELGNAHANLGAVAVQQGDLDRAREYFENARDAQLPLVERQPDNTGFLLALTQQYGWLTHVEAVQRRYRQALEPARAQADLLRRLVRLAPDDANYRQQLAAGLQQLIYNEAALQPMDPAASELREVLELTRGLAALDPANVQYQRSHEVSLSYLESAYLAAADLGDARGINAESLDLARRLFRRAPESAEALDDLLASLSRSVKLAWLEADAARASSLLDEAFQLPLTAKQRSERNPARWLELELLAWWTAADRDARTEHAQRARQWLEKLRAAATPAPPELMMRFHALEGAAAEAAGWARQLTPVERQHPYVVQFCRQNPCEPLSPAATRSSP